MPLGRPVSNVHVYVVDERLELVPLGAPGEIVFSGVCVGRGYVNDPERTRLAFMPDPHRPGERLYRSGDHGRWLPDGRLEFLGRRDGQVKVSGFRIEIGEVESALARVPGIGQGAVVVAEPAGSGKQLVAFYTAPGSLDSETIRAVLGSRLPAYMIPAACHRLERLPLGESGKVDRKHLVALAGELGDDADEHQTPSTPTERRLASAWAAVLGSPSDRIARRDDFFDRGGTSLSAVKLVMTLDGAVSLKEATRHPVLADLAELVDARAGATTATPPAAAVEAIR